MELSCIKWIVQSHMVRLLLRIKLLCIAIWIYFDMGLDGRQLNTYYNHSYNNGSYITWAMEYRNLTNSTHLHSVSKGYFITACLVWILPPVLLSLGGMVISPKEPNQVLKMILREGFGYRLKLPSASLTRLIATLLLLPVDILASIIYIYVLIPFASLQHGLKIAISGEKIEKNEHLFLSIRPATLLYLKCFEALGEALPQLILNILFMLNNHEFFFQDNQAFLGINEFSISITSIFFSLGSVAYGLHSTLPALYDFIKAQTEHGR